MARKLRPDEAEMFDREENDAALTDAEIFLRKLSQAQKESSEMLLIPGPWFSNSPPGPSGS
jgi:hypothetical protein